MIKSLIVSLVVVLAAGAASASPDADQLDLSRGLFVALGAVADGHRPCRATCEDKPLAEGFNNECFGLLKVFCGPPPVTPGEPPKHELMGAACQGHWRSMAVEVPSGAGGAPVPSLVTVCEGGHRWMASKLSTCPHTNHTTKKLMGVLSLGEIITVMSVSGADAALLAPHVRPDLAATHLATEVLQELQRWNLPRSAPAATKVQEATRSFAIESKHHGFKVEWQATKRVPPSSSPALEETFETLDDEAKETMGPSWRDWLPSGPPPPEQHGNGTFELLCNGKPAWLHGAVPCHGNFTVAATRTSSSSASSAAPGDKKPCGGKKKMLGGHGDKLMGPHTHHVSLRRLLASPLHLVEPGTTSSSIRAVDARQHVPAAKGKLGTTHTSNMKAECDGLWTGLLGHTCFGVSTSHLEVTEEVEKAAKSGTATSVKADEDEDEDVHALAKWSVCSGHQSIRFVHRDMTFGMAVSCKGASVVSLNMTVPWHA